MRSLVVLFTFVAAACAAPYDVEKRSVAHAVAYSYPTAVSHQSRVDVRSSPAVVANVPVVAAPVVEARAVYTAPSAVSHQSRVDYRSLPAVYTAAPVVPESVVYAPPVTTQYVGGSAVTHESRVDVHSSPAVVAEHIVGPAVVEVRSAWSPSVYASAW